MSALVLAAILAVGAPAASTPSPDPAAPQVAVDSAKPRPEPLSIWRPDTDGTAEHLQSGLRCPQQVGGYARTTFTAFDGFGFDAGCGYGAAGTTLSLYLTRTGKLDEAFENAKAAVVQAFAARNPRLLSDERLPADGLDWRRAVYAFDGGEQSEIWLADLHGWAFKYRVTYPAAEAAAVRASLSAVTSQARATAGVRLAACAKAAPSRPGKLLSAKGFGSNPTLLAALLSAAAPDEAGEAAPRTTYCVEEAFSADGKGFLLWRGVMSDGADAKADRLTAMTLGAPPTLEVALDETGNAITSELTGKAQSRWVATMSGPTRPTSSAISTSDHRARRSRL